MRLMEKLGLWLARARVAALQSDLAQTRAALGAATRRDPDVAKRVEAAFEIEEARWRVLAAQADPQHHMRERRTAIAQAVIDFHEKVKEVL